MAAVQLIINTTAWTTDSNVILTSIGNDDAMLEVYACESVRGLWNNKLVEIYGLQMTLEKVFSEFRILTPSLCQVYLQHGGVL